MTTEATVEAHDETGVEAGVFDELVTRVAGLGHAASAPGPPTVASADTIPATLTLLIAGRRVEPGPAPVFLGRSPSMFGIDHPKVSRRHVGVQLVDGVLIATDLGSRNGTWLVRDGQRIALTAMAVLRPGDRLVTLDDVELVRVEAAGSP